MPPARPGPGIAAIHLLNPILLVQESTPVTTRNYAQIHTRMWSDADFVSLSAGAQRLYIVLLSQPNLNNAGIVPLQIRRWSNLAANSTIEGVKLWLKELQDAQYVVIDEDTEELLIRSFIRNDGLWKQPNVFKSALGDVVGTLSVTLRGTLRAELARIPLDKIKGKLAEEVKAQVLGVIETLPIRVPETLPETPKQTLLEGSGVGVGVGVGVSFTNFEKNEVKEPSPSVMPAPTPKKPEASEINKRANALASAYMKVQPMAKHPAISGIAKKAINTGNYSDEEIHDALLRLAKDGRSVTVDTLRVEIEGFPPPRIAANGAGGNYQPKPSTTSQRVNMVRDAGAQVRAQLAGGGL